MASRPKRVKKREPIEIPNNWFKPEDDYDETKYVCPTVECDKCGRDVPFFIHRTRLHGMVHGVRYRYKGKKAHCGICGNTVYLPEIILYNFRRLILESQKDKYKENEDGE